MKDTRKLWEIVNQFINKTKITTLLVSINSNFDLTNETQVVDKASQFKEYFKNVIYDIKDEI